VSRDTLPILERETEMINKSDENKIRSILIEAMETATNKIAEETIVSFYWHADTPARMAESALQVVLSCEDTNQERDDQEG